MAALWDWLNAVLDCYGEDGGPRMARGMMRPASFRRWLAERGGGAA